MNQRGENLLSFCTKNNLFVTNTNFKHKASRKWTWTSPDLKSHNMIDFIMIRKRWKSSVTSCRSFQGADFGNTDHNLVLANIKLKMKAIIKKEHKRIRLR